MRKINLSKESLTMLKSWAKVFLAASFAVYVAGNATVANIVNSGLIAVIPVIISWLDPTDTRFGHYSVQKPVAKKVVAKKK